MNSNRKPIKLDWNKLVGFAQAKGPAGNPTIKRTKAMVGNKPKIGAKNVSPNT